MQHDHDDHPMTPELAAVILDWESAAAHQRALTAPRPCFGCGAPAVHTLNGRRWCRDCAPWPTPPAPRAHVTAQMIADIWRVEGPQRVAGILRQLPHDERERLARAYWSLLRGKGHDASLVEIGIQFCVVERLAA